MGIFNRAYLTKAEQVFLHPSETYRWNDIIQGTEVKDQGGNIKKMFAVAQNTFRGFHKIDKTCPGAKKEFIEYFVDHKPAIMDQLNQVENRSDLNEISTSICREIKARLVNNRPDQLASYNKIRKPVDLYIEHLVAMSSELTQSRQTLIPLLFLPLDSQVFQHTELFTIDQLKSQGLKRSSTFQFVRSTETYTALQQMLQKKTEKLSRELNSPFYVIYFDLIWNDRYRKRGNNLFQTNC